jgi:formylglycine-generating enzyme required for sulfatase activity
MNFRRRMKNVMTIVACLAVTTLFLYCNDKKDKDEIEDDEIEKESIPVLTTNAASQITCTTATLGGAITDAGMPAYTERGVCYATTKNPTIENNQIEIEGKSIGNFSVKVEALTVNTTYYVRAYAINEAGTVYGNEVSFTTLPSPEIEMIFVEGGTFMMGSPEGVGIIDERPQHQVTLSSFNIGKYEVTQSQWEVVMGSNPSTLKTGDNYPVESVSWYDVEEFIVKLNALTGKNYRLPTEAEWEYAARGGNKSNNYIYSGSDNSDDVAWHWNNSDGTYHQVGTKLPNELGIYDMSGNVYEWCYDWAGSYTTEAQTDPTGYPAVRPWRIFRGGTWHYAPASCRVAYRGFTSPDERQDGLGFRLALVN